MQPRYPREQMHRIRYTKLTEAQIAAKLAASKGPTSASPLSDVFAGKALTIKTDDGPALAYRFTGNNRLTVAENGGKAIAASYGALTLDHAAVLSHLVPGTQRGYHLLLGRAARQVLSEYAGEDYVRGHAQDLGSQYVHHNAGDGKQHDQGQNHPLWRQVPEQPLERRKEVQRFLDRPCLPPHPTTTTGGRRAIFRSLRCLGRGLPIAARGRIGYAALRAQAILTIAAHAAASAALS